MLLDTTVLVDLNRGYEPAIKAFSSKLHNQKASILTKFELVVGCRNKAELKATMQLVNNLEIEFLGLEEETTNLSEKILERFHLSKSLGIQDSLIAATALVHNQKLATHNTKHFDFIPKLKLVKPY